MNRNAKHHLALLLILFGLGWFYARTVTFSLFWDDPEWFGRVVGQPWWFVLLPSSDYHFYRPGLMLINWFFWQMDGVTAVFWLHVAQISWHLLNVALVYAIVRHLQRSRWLAVFVALLVGLYPFSYQAAAWAAPAQPITLALQNGAWLGYLAARRDGRLRYRPFALSLLLFSLALITQESSVPLAVLPLLMEWFLHRPSRKKSAYLMQVWPALVYLIPAGLFTLVWLSVPRESGFTAFGFDPRVWLTLWQGVVYPLTAWPVALPDLRLPLPWLALWMLLGTAGLVALAVGKRRGRLAAFALAWVVLGIAPAMLGLSYAYVSLAPRLLYFAAPGAALLWVAALWPLSRRRGRIGPLVLLGIALLSGLLLVRFDRFYRVGVAHLAELQVAIGEADGRYLFLNFPDQYREKKPPFAIGEGGLPLAPVVQKLGDYPAILTGHRPETTSRAVPWVDADTREAGPYQVDMRGVIAPPEELPGLAAGFDRVFVTRYGVDGRFSLHNVGSIRPTQAKTCSLAQIGDALCLQSVSAGVVGDVVRVEMAWQLLRDDLTDRRQHSIFVQVGTEVEPLLAQADGNAWQGTLPLFVWPADMVIQDIRTIPRPAADDLAVRIGVYNWVTGERLPALSPDGRRLPNDAVIAPISP